jgi:hypothetical protein
MDPSFESYNAHALYIVLQGEFVLFRERTTHPDHDTLHILAPDVPCHVYKAGPWPSDWLKLDDLPPTRLHLRHAFGDRKQGKCHHPRAIPERNTDLLLSGGPRFPSTDLPRVHITAPIPLAILSGRAETADGVAITFVPPRGRATTRPAPPHASVISILLYEWRHHRPCLADEWDNCIAETGGPSDDLQSMNIYASSPVDETDPTHAQEAFQLAAALLGENASISEPGLKFKKLFATPPPGLAWAQVNLFLSDIIRLKDDPILKARFVDISDTRLADDPISFVTGEFTNCGQITADDDGIDVN